MVTVKFDPSIRIGDFDYRRMTDDTNYGWRRARKPRKTVWLFRHKDFMPDWEYITDLFTHDILNNLYKQHPNLFEKKADHAIIKVGSSEYIKTPHGWRQDGKGVSDWVVTELLKKLSER